MACACNLVNFKYEIYKNYETIIKLGTMIELGTIKFYHCRYLVFLDPFSCCCIYCYCRKTILASSLDILCWSGIINDFFILLIYIYVYIGIFQQTICCSHTPQAFCRNFKQLKNFFWVSHFTPDCEANERVPLPLTKYFYNMNWMGYNS